MLFHTKRLLSVFLILGLILSGAFTFSKEVEAAEVVPTVLIHGYNGSEETFKTLINHYQDSATATLNNKCVVETNGKVTCTHYKKQTNKPLVQVIFKNNKASLNNQTTWLKRVLVEVNKQYKAKQINIISHSMGGLLSTKYILDTAKSKSYPKVKRLVTLDSPIKGTTSFNQGKKSNDSALIDLEPSSKAIKNVYSKRKNFPKDVEVFSIVAVSAINIVGHTSAYGLKDYTTNIKTDWFNEDHTTIHEAKRVLNAVSDFVW